MLQQLIGLLILLVHNGSGQEEIYFPREQTYPEAPCTTYDGRRGNCRLLVQCATFFAEIAELSRSPCSITDQQQGVCCPPTKGPTKDPVHEASKKELPNREIYFPQVTLNDLNQASQKSIQQFQQREQFEQDLVNRNIIAEVGEPVFFHARLFETTPKIIKRGKDASLTLGTSLELQQTFHLDKTQAKEGLANFDVTKTIISDTCPPDPACPDPRHSYRTMDGTCNNINHKGWGSAGTSFTRMVAPEYQDGLNIPRLGSSNQPLPSPRVVSLAVTPSKQDIYSNLTLLVMQWGQFLDHDVTHTPISKGADMSDVTCCKRGQTREARDLHPECMPIDIHPNDPFYQQFNQRCMEFVRSMPAIRPQCSFGPREQMNQITSYLDASNVYGSSDEEAKDLRTFQGGELQVRNVQGRDLLPGDEKNVGCVSRSADLQCFKAGDTRVNEQPDLAVMHTIWVRQHNRIVRDLARLNPSWSDEVLFQEGRRIVIAQMQHITYGEYLPIVLGREFMETYGLLPLKEGYFRGYRDDVDATITNAFASAAFRYGHTLVSDSLQSYGKFGNLRDNMELSKTQFLPFVLYEPGTLDSLIRGLAIQKSQKFDRFFSEQLTNKLFAQNRPFGMDLVALNIQRGRDHGLPPYTRWRQICDLSPVNSWQDLFQNMDPDVVAQLQAVYASVHDVDLFVGGISERTTGGSLLGPTFLCILGRQFIKLKIGDRFYYENGAPGRNRVGDQGEPMWSFTETQLREIRKTSLSRILCDNSDDIQLMQPLAFVSAHLANQRAACNSEVLIPRMRLEPWRNQRIWA